MGALDFLYLGATREDGRIGQVVARDEIGHGALGPLLLLAEAIEFPLPLELNEAGENSVHALPERNTTKVLGVKDDLVPIEGNFSDLEVLFFVVEYK